MAYGAVYGLHDPSTGELRYIGQTTTTVAARLSVHMAPASLRKHSYVCRWLRGLNQRGLRPTTSIIAEAADQEELDRLEIHHIAAARAAGVRLTNLSDGGGGPSGRVVSQETREKIAAKQRGVPKPKHTDEWRANMSERMAGRCTNTPEHMAMLHEMRVGSRHTEETKARISAAKKGQTSGMKGRTHSAESRAKMSESQIGLMAGEKHPAFRHDIDTGWILAQVAAGKTKTSIAEELGVSTTFVHRRIRQAQCEGEA